MKKLLLSIFILLCCNPTAYPNDLDTNVTTKTQSLKNIAYGHHPQQAMDVYFPVKALTDKTPVPLIVMVHGGAWSRGDKNNAAVVKNKVDYWTKQNWIFISINYRLVPDVTVQQQTQDIAEALIYIQKQAPNWHADSKRLVLMGHSSGAHLVSLLTTRPLWLTSQPQPWRATVALDSAAYHVEKIMQTRHARLYDQAFGDQPSNWRALSPTFQLQQALPAFLAVCSTTRPDQPCAQAQQFIQQAQKLGTKALLLPLPLSHIEINKSLGKNNPYTQAVDQFIQSNSFTIE
ncbi:alpha/beta hydrolase [Acinetobacter kyonggiensis]|uniref:Acetyl esterase/lipase n=1 Tax=Acinetobacter kyonggiensis TaxID=595670 RepID=A0A1H3J2W4_9GAMM|nr:alpha/beta hydrolase [Acinetobacter kyonggiensis]SDY34333.1 Acetyl esterase/lipase [Acinetobacter kyonggiensis]